MLHNAKENKGEGKEGTHRSTLKLTERERESTRVRERGRENTSTGMMGKEVATYEPGMSQDLVISSDNSMED